MISFVRLIEKSISSVRMPDILSSEVRYPPVLSSTTRIDVVLGPQDIVPANAMMFSDGEFAYTSTGDYVCQL